VTGYINMEKTTSMTIGLEDESWDGILPMYSECKEIINKDKTTSMTIGVV
jgi:hypothetical protein